MHRLLSVTTCHDACFAALLAIVGCGLCKKLEPQAPRPVTHVAEVQSDGCQLMLPTCSARQLATVIRYEHSRQRSYYTCAPICQLFVGLQRGSHKR